MWAPVDSERVDVAGVLMDGVDEVTCGEGIQFSTTDPGDSQATEKAVAA